MLSDLYLPYSALVRYFSPSTMFSCGRTRTLKQLFRKPRLLPCCSMLMLRLNPESRRPFCWALFKRITSGQANLMQKQSRVWTQAQVQSCWKQQCRQILATFNPGRKGRLASSGTFNYFRFVWHKKYLCWNQEYLLVCTAFCAGCSKPVQRLSQNERGAFSEITKFHQNLNNTQCTFCLPGVYLLWLRFLTLVWLSNWTMTVRPARWRPERFLKMSKTSLKSNGIELGCKTTSNGSVFD